MFSSETVSFPSLLLGLTPSTCKQYQLSLLPRIPPQDAPFRRSLWHSEVELTWSSCIFLPCTPAWILLSSLCWLSFYCKLLGVGIGLILGPWLSTIGGCYKMHNNHSSCATHCIPPASCIRDGLLKTANPSAQSICHGPVWRKKGVFPATSLQDSKEEERAVDCTEEGMGQRHGHEGRLEGRDWPYA